MQVTAADELSAAALGRFLRDRGCAVYRTGSNTLEVSPLGSVAAARVPGQLATYVKEWLVRHPGNPVLFEVH